MAVKILPPCCYTPIEVSKKVVTRTGTEEKIDLIKKRTDLKFSYNQKLKTLKPMSYKNETTD